MSEAFKSSYFGEMRKSDPEALGLDYALQQARACREDMAGGHGHHLVAHRNSLAAQVQSNAQLELMRINVRMECLQIVREHSFNGEPSSDIVRRADVLAQFACYGALPDTVG